MESTGERRILFGLGVDRIQRRKGGDWVNAYDDLRDYVRLPKQVKPGRYRHTNRIRPRSHPRRDRKAIREVIQVTAPA